MVAGNPAVGDAVTVTTPKGRRWDATVVEVGEADPETGEVLCLTVGESDFAVFLRWLRPWWPVITAMLALYYVCKWYCP